MGSDTKSLIRLLLRMSFVVMAITTSRHDSTEVRIMSHDVRRNPIADSQPSTTPGL